MVARVLRTVAKSGVVGQVWRNTNQPTNNGESQPMTDAASPTIPFTGQEFLDSLDDGREVWIYGERVRKITDHPAFRNTARMIARLYDALHADHAEGKHILSCPTEWGGFTHRYFVAPRTIQEQVASRDAIAAWARLSYGWFGRSPDYKAAFLATLGANAEFYAPWQENARRWYRQSQERVPFINHAIIHPPVDRSMAPGAAGGPTDVYMHITKETDAGIRVSGAKVVATGSALTHFTFVAHHGLIPVQDKNFAVVFMMPTNAPGIKLICRTSNEYRAAALGSPFDYPLSSRLDENDAIFVMDDVLVPWENVFVHADIDTANNFFPRTGFLPRALLHGCTRLAVKLDFIAGLLLKATEMTGTRGFRGVEANLGEVIAWRNMIWGLSDAMAKTAAPWTGGHILPGSEPASAYQVLAPEAYVQIKTLVEKTVASGLIYMNSHAADFAAPELRKYLDLYLRGSGGASAEERVKLMKLLWDAVGTEFGGRHELYEINYSGSHEEIRRYALFGALASGDADRWKGFAESCLAEYDLNGWVAPDLVNADDVSILRRDRSQA
jgi:aromatic ring hydroxylase